MLEDMGKPPLIHIMTSSARLLYTTNTEPYDLTIFWISSTFKKVEEQVFGALVDIQITGIYTEQKSAVSGHQCRTLNLTVGSQKLLFFMRTL